MSIRRLIAVALAILAISINFSYSAELSKEYTECINSKTKDQEWNECSKQEMDRQEKSLAGAWTEAYTTIKEVSARSAQLLLDEQRAWVKYKDTSCLFYASGDFGREGQVLEFSACKAVIIAQRIDSLKVLTRERKE
jgi:uncharacterized protein YecT (DUF1311 family)